MANLQTLLENPINDGSHVLHDVGVREPEGAGTVFAEQKVVALTILVDAFSGFVMLAAIDFDGELFGWAVEVDDIFPERMLAEKTEPVDLSSPKPVPYPNFRFGHGFSKRSRARLQDRFPVGWHRSSIFSFVTFLSSNPSCPPLGTRGENVLFSMV